MRNLKFRAWDTIDNEWKYSGHPHQPMWKFWESVELGGGYENVCQYTGLRDRNGKEIYEHDLVKVVAPNSIIKEERTGVALEVKDLLTMYQEGNHWIFEAPADAMEVIGNVHENPELISSDKPL